MYDYEEIELPTEYEASFEYVAEKGFETSNPSGIIDLLPTNAYCSLAYNTSYKSLFGVGKTYKELVMMLTTKQCRVIIKYFKIFCEKEEIFILLQTNNTPDFKEIKTETELMKYAFQIPDPRFEIKVRIREGDRIRIKIVIQFGT